MRLTDSVLSEENVFSDTTRTTIVDVAGEKSGQMGMTTHLEGVIANASYIRRNLLCYVLRSPEGFNDLPNPEVWHSTFKALMEVGSRSISGLNSTLNVEFASSDFGAAGEQQEDFAKTTRERSVPVHVFIEKYGKPINRFFDTWIRMLLGDPETGIPGIVTLGNGDGPTDLLPDYTGATCLYIEPDPLHKTVVTAWIITNMMPNTAGEVVGERDITAPGQTTEYSIQFTGIQQVGSGVNAIAQQFLDNISLTGANPHRREAWIKEMSADLANSASSYQKTVESLANEQVESI